MSQSRLLVLAGDRRKDRHWHLAASYMHICIGGCLPTHITRTETQRTPTTFSAYLHVISATAKRHSTNPHATSAPKELYSPQPFTRYMSLKIML